ncbi:MAG TPA: hemerythrin domain-containing protein [Burkholderiales bacterium]|jgi:hemerythrin superfamily protein|nr:hemerythrin domain-containing protein [Burkholderiales bacterium]
MNSVIEKLSPSVTNMIRMDHTKVIATFHQYKADSSPRMKQALASTVCLSVEIHAQLEEEIFYPAMAAFDPELVISNIPEHDEMRVLISALRELNPGEEAYDAAFLALMRTVMHHVAEEETILLPDAERLLRDRLSELGAQMTKRRVQLLASHAGEIAWNAARSRPATAALAGAGVLVAGGYLLRYGLKHAAH